MWKKLKNSNFFISCSEDYEIYVTDYVTIWFAHLYKTGFFSCLKECNSLLEMSDDALLQKGRQVLSDPGNLKSLDTKLEDKMLAVNMTMLFGYPFKLNLKLCEGSRELFYEKLTKPLLNTIIELKNSQAELCQLLDKKDSEIEEYKCEGGEIALKHLKTKPFNKQAVMSKYTSFEKFFGQTNDLINDLIQLPLKIPENKRSVKTETPEVSSTSTLQPQRIKIEPTSQNSHTNDTTQAIPVKPESNTQNFTVKTEPSSHTISVKLEENLDACNAKAEQNSQISESQSSSSVSPRLNLKQESGLSIKRESQSVPAIRKKMKKLF